MHDGGEGQLIAEHRALAELRVHRFDAAGNVVALVDGRASPLSPEALFHRLLFPRCADFGSPRPEIFGVVSHASGALRADFWNPDATRERVCANALRCIPSLLRRERVTVLTDHCAFDVFAPGAGVGALQLPERHVTARQIAEGEWIVDPGSPHLVMFVVDLHAPEVAARGLSRSSDEAWVNVTFVDVRPDALHVRTFERSVGETGSCGTGALAAFVAHRACGSPPALDEAIVAFASGEALRVARSAPAWLTLSGRCELQRVHRTFLAADHGPSRGTLPVERW